MMETSRNSEARLRYECIVFAGRRLCGRSDPFTLVGVYLVLEANTRHCGSAAYTRHCGSAAYTLHCGSAAYTRPLTPVI